MSMDEQFADAQKRVKTLTQMPSNENLLQLYALYKQGDVGDVQGKRPGMLDIKGRAKWDAWGKVKGIAGDDAKQRYVDLVDGLVG